MLLTPNTDGPDITQFSPPLATVWDWVPIAENDGGTYITDLANGIFRLGAQPVGTVTANPELQKGISHADAVEYLLKTYAGRVNDDLNLSSFGVFNDNNPGGVSRYWRDPSQSVLSEIGSLLKGIFGFWYYIPNGQLSLGQVRTSPNFIPLIREEDIIEQPTTVQPELPHKKRTARYARNYTVQDGEGLSSAAEDPAFASEQYRTNDQTFSIPQRLGAIDSEVDMFFDSEELVVTELIRQLVLLGAVNFLPWNIKVRDRNFEFTPGQTVRVSYPRFSFGSGRNMIVLSVSENSGFGTPGS